MGIFVCSCWATLPDGVARWVAFVFAGATSIWMLVMVFFIFPTSARKTYVVSKCDLCFTSFLVEHNVMG